jgi:ATP-dependent Zn protease
LLPEEKHSVAVHESGHALVAVLSEHAGQVGRMRVTQSGCSCPPAGQQQGAAAGETTPHHGTIRTTTTAGAR